MKRVVFSTASILFLGTLAPGQNLQFKNPPVLAKPNGYTQVVIVNHGKLAFISGQVGLNSKGEISSDFAAQAKQAFANLKTALAAAGATPADIVKLNYCVVGLNHAIASSKNSIRPPARSPARNRSSAMMCRSRSMPKQSFPDGHSAMIVALW